MKSKLIQDNSCSFGSFSLARPTLLKPNMLNTSTSLGPNKEIVGAEPVGVYELVKLSLIASPNYSTKTIRLENSCIERIGREHNLNFLAHDSSKLDHVDKVKFINGVHGLESQCLAFNLDILSNDTVSNHRGNIDCFVTVRG